MILLLDAYNIIRHLFVHKEAEADARRDWFMQRMARYFAAKQGPVKQVIVVFDGGLFGHRQRDIYRGVVRLYAGRGHSADDVLVEYAEKYGNQAVVVTNDRELQQRCKQHHGAVVSVKEFDQLVEEVCSHVEQEQDRVQYDEVVVQKYEHDETDHDPALDELMRAGSVHAVHKPESRKEKTLMSSGSKKERRVRHLKQRLGK